MSRTEQSEYAKQLRAEVSDSDIARLNEDLISEQRKRIAALESDLTAARAECDALLGLPIRLDEVEWAGNPVIAWRAYHKVQSDLAVAQNEIAERKSLEAQYQATLEESERNQLGLSVEIRKAEADLAAARADAHARLRAVKRMKRVARHWRKVVGEIKLVVVPHISK